MTRGEDAPIPAGVFNLARNAVSVISFGTERNAGGGGEEGGRLKYARGRLIYSHDPRPAPVAVRNFKFPSFTIGSQDAAGPTTARDNISPPSASSAESFSRLCPPSLPPSPLRNAVVVYTALIRGILAFSAKSNYSTDDAAGHRLATRESRVFLQPRVLSRRGSTRAFNRGEAVDCRGGEGEQA
jgi:hypothetical protein